MPPSNRLATETSPYLRQHADNPVDWYPWGEEAFAQAAAERPADLPVGRLLGLPLVPRDGPRVLRGPGGGRPSQRRFVCVKVDREERPDVDAVYMEAVQAMTGSGGWPMSVFLTPTGGPSTAAPTSRPADHPGRPSFTTVLDALTDIWDNRRAEVEEQADELAGAIAARSVIETRPGAASLLDAAQGADRPTSSPRPSPS